MTMSDGSGSTGRAGGVPSIWGKIPPRNKNFTGREHLFSQLRERLDRGNTTAVLPQALQGIGGVGKTQMAIEFAYRYQADYDVVWWISADQVSLVTPALAALAPHLGLESARSIGIEDAAAAVSDALRRGDPYGRWLLIFDNADRPEDLRPLLPSGPGRILITSRNQGWRDLVDAIMVDVFDREESVEFLNRRAPGAISRADALRLAENLGDLPLALEQAGALQAQTGMSTDEYLGLLRRQPLELLSQPPTAEYPESMTGAWRLSVAKLEEQLPEAVALLQACAFFGPEPIPVDVFGWGIVEEDSALRDVLANPLLRAQAVGMLGRFALGRIDSASRTIQVHRLVQAMIREALPEERRTRIRHDVHLLLAGAAPPDPQNEGSRSRFAELVPHVEPAGVAHCRDPKVRRFVSNVGRYKFEVGDTMGARSFLEGLLALWESEVESDDQWTSKDREIVEVRRQLARVLREQGLLTEAYALSESALRDAQRVLGQQNDETLLIFRDFGIDLRYRGEFRLALERGELALRLYRDRYGEEHPETLGAMHNLAIDHSIIGNFQQAKELHERAFLLQSGMDGVIGSDVLRYQNGLARTVRLAGEFSVARFMGQEAYDYGRQTLGADALGTLRAGRDLSIAMRRDGALEEAVELSREIFTKYERLNGPSGPETLGAAMTLSNALRTVGELEDAYALAETAMARYPRVYGGSHPFNQACLSDLAVLCRARGEVGRARRLNEHSLQALNEKLGRDHYYPLFVAANLASDLRAEGELDAALALGRDTFERMTRTLGEEHPTTLACAANLVYDLRASGMTEEADGLEERTVSRYAAKVGRDHPDIVAIRNGERMEFDFDPPPV